MGFVHLSALWEGKINMKNSIKSKPKSPAIITTLSFPINTSWQRQWGMEVSCLLKWQAHSFLIRQAAFSLRSSGCSQKPDIVPLTAPPLALSISQDCFSLKSLGDNSSQDLKDCAYLKLVWFLARRGGERWMGNIVGQHKNSNNCVRTMPDTLVRLSGGWRFL